jgi:hypothetical protein
MRSRSASPSTIALNPSLQLADLGSVEHGHPHVEVALGRPGAPSASARAAAGRSRNSVRRYAHDAVTKPVSVITTAMRRASAVE